MLQALSTVQTFLGVQVQQTIEEVQLNILQPASVPLCKGEGLSDGEGDVAVRRVHLEEHAVLDDDGSKHLLDAVQLVDV